MKKLICLVTWMIIQFIFLISSLNAAVWYVHPDSTLNSIQAGLDTASAGDTVLVAPGTYKENIVWPSVEGIDLVSEFGPDSTIINANSAGRAIKMAQYLSATTVIDGFTIINGWATGTSPNDYGGGIYCLNTSPLIRNNIISNNSGYSRGGGIYCENSSPYIVGNIIQGNGTSGWGGGVCCVYNAMPFIQENNFYNNSAVRGGAIMCYKRSDANIQYSQILSNNATFGEGVFAGSGAVDYSIPSIHYSSISGNEPLGIFCDNYFSDQKVRAQYNWWGHPAGPDSGDVVSGPITYEPFLTEEIVFDISIISIEEPSDTICAGTIYTPKILVKNNCNYDYPVSFFTATCTINGYRDYVRIDSLVQKDSTLEVTFADWTVPPQDSTTYLINVTIFYAVDMVSINDTISKRITPQKAATDKPGLVSPAYNSSGGVNTTYTWSSVLRATQYQFQFDTSDVGDFVNPVNDIIISDTFYTVSGFDPDKVKGTNWWRVRGKNTCGEGPWSDPFEYTDVKDENYHEMPSQFSLNQNYPNPFNPQTKLEFTLSKGCHVRLDIYNILGKRIRTLINEHQTAGYKRVSWDGKDDNGNEVPTGVYFYRIKAGEFTQAKKMILLK